MFCENVEILPGPACTEGILGTETMQAVTCQLFQPRRPDPAHPLRQATKSSRDLERTGSCHERNSQI